MKYFIMLLLLCQIMYYFYIICLKNNLLFVYINKNLYTQNTKNNKFYKQNLKENKIKYKLLESKNIINRLHDIPIYKIDIIPNKKEKLLTKCIIKYSNKDKNLVTDKWIFNGNININDIENTPTILKFLFLTTYSLGNIKNISCMEIYSNINYNCIECIKLSTGYDNDLLIPIYNNKSLYECMNINNNMNINMNINMFCKII